MGNKGQNGEPFDLEEVMKSPPAGLLEDAPAEPEPLADRIWSALSKKRKGQGTDAKLRISAADEDGIVLLKTCRANLGGSPQVGRGGESVTRHFSVEEANRALTRIQPWIREILQIRDRIIARHPEVWPAIERSAGNGGSTEASRMEPEFSRLDHLVHQVLATGALIKDINRGLVDFPALREGREVFLCWCIGEDDVQFWHERQEGFGGRQRI